MQRPCSLDTIKLVNALYGVRCDWALPWMYLMLLLVFITLSFFPGALWAGAITPVLTTKTLTKRLALPSFSNITWLENDIVDNSTYTQNTAKGIFTYLPEFDLQGLILNAAQDASSRNGGANSHAKLDKTGYVYSNRSYGMGSSVGLTDDFGPHMSSYTYNETGYLAEPSCIYNSTSEWQLDAFPQQAGFSMMIFNAEGELPNGVSPIYAAAALSATGVVAVGAGTNRDDSEPAHYVAFATGNGTLGKYGPLSNIQCEVTFEPMDFLVSVNVTNRTISVLPFQSADQPLNATNVTYQTIHTINNLGSVLATTLWISVIGDAFINNIANVQAAQGASNASNLQGVTDSLSSIIDNTLGAYSAAQLMLRDDSTLAIARTQYVGVIFGSSGYIYSIIVINLAVCIVYIFECFRSRGWRNLSKFNFMDVKSVVIGTSMGGEAIANEVISLHDAQASAWHAAEYDRLVGKVRIRLGKSSKGDVAVMLAEEEGKASLKPSLGYERRSSEAIPLVRSVDRSTRDRTNPNAHERKNGAAMEFSGRGGLCDVERTTAPLTSSCVPK